MKDVLARAIWPSSTHRAASATRVFPWISPAATAAGPGHSRRPSWPVRGC